MNQEMEKIQKVGNTTAYSVRDSCNQYGGPVSLGVLYGLDAVAGIRRLSHG